MKEAAMQGGTGEKLGRKWLVSLLYRPIGEVSSLSSGQFWIESSGSFINGIQRDIAAVKRNSP